MTIYEKAAFEELKRWQRKTSRGPSPAGRLTKKIQDTMNSLIPEKVHVAVTKAIKEMVRVVLFGAGFTAKKIVHSEMLEATEEKVQEQIEFYKKTAAAEGGIAGAGGILLGIAEFPVLLSLKMKLLFDIAAIYGFNVKDYKERLYILYVFQLAFCSSQRRSEVYGRLNDWDNYSRHLPDDIHQFEWRTFQQEYRDYIDLAKLAQLIPVIGAAIGVVVNYRLITKLGETAMYAYRMRLLKEA
ncbi:MAG TPA: EcsC family protein [Chitinophagales bacterium]|nr:EcsC family protein [Chitinophagales bacterium]